MKPLIEETNNPHVIKKGQMIKQTQQEKNNRTKGYYS